MNPRKDLSGEFASLWARLDGARGKKYWRTLEELADTDAFQEMLRREFPEQAAAWPSGPSRRQFLTLMGASLALAGLSGCSVRPAPEVTLVPYVRAPEEVIPGKPLYFATAMTLGGCGVGLLVQSHLGRPTKIEGNPDHPASGGATDIYHQASVLTLYDPDRSQTVTNLGQTRSWDEALAALRSALAKQRDQQGAGLRILTETVVSPTLIKQLQDFLRAFPNAKWHQYEPLAPDGADQSAVQAFGKPVHTIYDFTKADVVVAFDGDYLMAGPGCLRYTADFMARRRVRTKAEDAGQAKMNRLYVVESAVTCTGAKADHRLAVRPSGVEGIVWALAAELGVPDVPTPGNLTDAIRKWVRAVANDLRGPARAPGTTLVLAGDRQPAAVHLVVRSINRHLGNVGHTVLHTQPIAAQPAVQTGPQAAAGGSSAPVERMASLRRLAEEMDQGGVEILLLLGGNPAYASPADLRFAERMQKVPLRVHLSLFQDETSRQCHWHLPETHYLEAWSDTRAYDGRVSIVQPLIQPLYQGRSAHELLAALTPAVNPQQSAGYTWRQVPGYETVRGYWREQYKGSDFETFWQQTLHDGVMADSALKHEDFRWDAGAAKALAAGPSKAPPSGGYELHLQPDPTIYDGRFANNGWLQELPKPITTLTWDNAALLSPQTAKELGVTWGSYAHGGEHGGYYQSVLELRLGDRAVKAPAWIVPGQADGCITLHLGYGRQHAGRVGGAGPKVGCDAYPLHTTEHSWFAPGLAARVTRERYLLACTQQHHLMEGREVVRAGALDEFHQRPRFAAEKDEKAEQEMTRIARKPLTLYKPHPYPAHKWGMAIDLTACTGCKACVVACQAENNIPVVGKEQVAAGREMHWLRVDRYIGGPAQQPTEFHFQPVPCMHCENAPCEYVCPTVATVHSADGLNDMVYQRCVGTRFCSNNCPYKVRRFNFHFYADYATESTRMQYNPDVTVRSRGVMEKCSYCVQRIRHAEIDAQVEGRAVFDGEILTACQAACPAGAIIFGDINDTKSEVKKWKESPLHYALLADLNTEPRTTYLAALRNPNPKLEGA
jgi:molybdopterin-containing oxidoreductase family iron-sulfur binding subunit